MRGISRRHTTYFRVLRTDEGGKRRRTRPPRRRPAALDLGRGGAPQRASTSCRSPCATAPATSAATRQRSRRTPGATPGPRGITVRTLAVQPPLRPITAGTRGVLRRLPPAALPLGVRRVGGKRAVRRGKVPAAEASRCGCAPPRDAQGSTCSSCSRAVADPRPLPRPGGGARHVLVVVPAITWLGTDPVDDPPVLDGIPDMLTRRGDRVRWPRVFAGEDGLPPGLSEVAPLLRFLDAAGIRYDLTSDLDLALSRSPRASDRKGVLLAGSERWVTRPVGRRLRRYVLDGGRIAISGRDAAPRGHPAREQPETNGELAAPDQPSDRPVRRPRWRPSGPAPRGGRAGRRRPRLGLLTGFDGTLEGFCVRGVPAARRRAARVLAALGRGEADDARPRR